MDTDGGNKTQRIYRYRSNYALSIVNNGFEDQWRRENPDSSEFTHYDRSSGTRSRIIRVYSDKKIASNIKINHTMVSSTNHYNAISIERLPSKTKIGKDSWYFNNSFFSTKNLFFLLKTHKNTTTLQQVTGKKTPNFV